MPQEQQLSRAAGAQRDDLFTPTHLSPSRGSAGYSYSRLTGNQPQARKKGKGCERRPQCRTELEHHREMQGGFGGNGRGPGGLKPPGDLALEGPLR